MLFTLGNDNPNRVVGSELCGPGTKLEESGVSNPPDVVMGIIRFVDHGTTNIEPMVGCQVRRRSGLPAPEYSNELAVGHIDGHMTSVVRPPTSMNFDVRGPASSYYFLLS